MASPRTRRRLRWWMLAAVPLVGIGAYFLWGTWLSARFDERVAALRAEGLLQTIEDVRGPLPAEDDNGWTTLEAATEIYRRVDALWTERGLEDGTAWLTPIWDPDRPWTPEERADARRYHGEMAPFFKKLDEALAHAVLAPPPSGPMDEGGFIHPFRASQALYAAARLESEQVQAYLARMTRLLRRWDGRQVIDVVIRSIMWRSMVLPLLRDTLESGQITEPHGSKLEAALADEEARLLQLLDAHDKQVRASTLWIVGKWREGKDPGAETRHRLGETVRLLPPTSDESGPLSGLHRLVAATEPPWFLSWYGNPVLQREANLMLDGFEQAPLRPWNIERIRSELRAGKSSLQWAPAEVLHVIATLRLARIALAARPRTGPTLTPKTRLEAAAERLGGVLPDDPFTGAPFVIEPAKASLVLRCRLSKVLEATDEAYAPPRSAKTLSQMRADALLWYIP